jgi:hypothetical protein
VEVGAVDLHALAAGEADGFECDAAFEAFDRAVGLFLACGDDVEDLAGEVVAGHE